MMDGLEIRRIERIDELDLLGPDWERAYAADPQANVFVSWHFFRAWCEVCPHPWFVLAAYDRTSACHVAFLPLAMRYQRIRGIPLVRVMHMGGKPFGQYTCLVCLPEHEKTAVEALAHGVKALPGWDIFRMEEVIDPRIELFLQAFGDRGYRVDRVSSLSCPYVPLPGAFEAYLDEFMSYNGRYNLRRSFRHLEKLPGLRLTNVDDNSFDHHVATLLDLWQSRWGKVPAEELERYRHMYRRALEHGALWLKTLWDGQTPIASLAAYVDCQRQSVHYYNSGFNAEYGSYSPGKVLLGYYIRDAIEARLTMFDFLVGGHDYKLSFFGARERFACTIDLVRTTLRRQLGTFLLQSRETARRWRRALAPAPAEP